MSASESNIRPEPPRSAAMIFARTVDAVSATGNEPRVPQKRMRFIDGGASAGVVRAARPGRDRRHRVAHGGKNLEHLVEAADGEYLRDDRLQPRDRDARVPAAHLL